MCIYGGAQVLRAQVDAGNMARYAKDAQIASLVADSHAAITQCKVLCVCVCVQVLV